MLKKLLKYDLKNIFKFLIIFYTLALLFGISARIFLNIENSLVLNIIGQVFSGAAISMMFSILINNLMRMWVKLRQNFYGDEAYLTHTLPIKKNKLYLSKIITAAISTFVSMAVIVATLFVAYYSAENLEFVKSLLLPLGDAFKMNTVVLLLIFAFILFLEFLNILQCGFTGIILGHRMNNCKIGFSVLFGFVAFGISQLFVLLVIFVTALFNSDIMNLFVTNELLNMAVIKTVIILATLLYTIISLAICFINIKLFEKGVNVD